MSDFYVYLHRKVTTNEVFYVGKGSGRRAYDKVARSTWWKKTVAKHGYTVEIYMDNLQEWYALELEAELIAYYGRKDLDLGTLVNVSDGGQAGPVGFKLDEESRKKWSEDRSGVKNHRADRTVYDFVNLITGEEVSETRHGLKEKYGVNVGPIFKSQTCYTIKGWCLKQNIGKQPKIDPNIYTLYHILGDMFTGTRLEFKAKYNIDIDKLFNPTRRSKVYNGWMLEENKGCTHGKDHTEYLFMHILGNFLKCTRTEFKKITGLNTKPLFSKARKDTKSLLGGWCVVKEPADRLLYIYKIHNKYTEEVFTGLKQEFVEKYPTVPIHLFSDNPASRMKGWKVIEKLPFSAYNPCISITSVV